MAKRLFVVVVMAAVVGGATVLAGCASQGQGSGGTGVPGGSGSAAPGNGAAVQHPANDLYYHRDGIDRYLSAQFGEAIRTTYFDTSSEDMTFTIREGVLQSIILGEWNRQYQFHGVRYGDSMSGVAAQLGGDFYRTSAPGVFDDAHDIRYRLEVESDAFGTVRLVRYALKSLQ